MDELFDLFSDLLSLTFNGRVKITHFVKYNPGFGVLQIVHGVVLIRGSQIWPCPEGV